MASELDYIKKGTISLDKVGLVLAGGGGKGAYQIGVWKALREFGVDYNITAVSGTSVGALNAALFAQGDYDKAERVWLNITQDKILKLEPSKILSKIISAFSLYPQMLSAGYAAATAMALYRAKSGVFSREGLSELIDEALQAEQISYGGIPCYATCLEIPLFTKKSFNLQDMDPDKIKAVLLASSALPGIFGNIQIDEKSYIDGGLPPDFMT